MIFYRQDVHLLQGLGLCGTSRLLPADEGPTAGRQQRTYLWRINFINKFDQFISHKVQVDLTHGGPAINRKQKNIFTKNEKLKIKRWLVQCGPVMVHGNEKSSCQSLTDTDFSFWTWTKACQKKRDNLQKSIWITAFVLKGSEVAALQCWLQGLFAEM